MSRTLTHDSYGKNGDLRPQYTPARLALRVWSRPPDGLRRAAGWLRPGAGPGSRGGIWAQCPASHIYIYTYIQAYSHTSVCLARTPGLIVVMGGPEYALQLHAAYLQRMAEPDRPAMLPALRGWEGDSSLSEHHIPVISFPVQPRRDGQVQVGAVPAFLVGRHQIHMPRPLIDLTEV